MQPQQLKTFRTKLELTQQQLADALGIARNTVARWEMGSQAIPRIAELALVAIAGKPGRRFRDPVRKAKIQ